MRWEERKRFRAPIRLHFLRTSSFGSLGLLEGFAATCYPGNEEYLTGARTTQNEVEVSGQFVTSRGVGTAIPFALQIISLLLGSAQAEKIKNSIVFNQSL